MHHSTTLALNLVFGLAVTLATATTASAAPPADGGHAEDDAAASGVKLGGHERNSEARQQGLLLRFDRDGDGAFDKKELEAVRAELSREVTRRFDADGDGTLDAAERDEARSAARRHAASKAGGRAYGLLARFDVDGDGKFDEQELKRVRTAVHAAAIARFDADGNGSLDDEERARLKHANELRIRSLRERQAGEGGPEAGARGRREAVEDPVDAPGVGAEAELTSRGRRPAPEKRVAPGPGKSTSG